MRRSSSVIVAMASLLIVPLMLSAVSKTGTGASLQATAEITGTPSTTEPATPSSAAEMTSNPNLVIVRVYVDTNGDGIKGLGEGAEGILVIAVVSQGGLKGEAFTYDGEAIMGFQSLTEGTEVQVDIPYLQRSARYEIRRQGSPVVTDVRLEPARYPAYLP